MTTRLGDWILDEVLGHGSAAVVHAAHHHADAGVVVAVKRLARAPTAAVATLRREAAILAELAHPAIMPIRELVADGDGVALVMPLATGGSLATRLRTQGALGWREAADLGARVAGALAVAHDAGVLHRDVAPDNILYGAEDEPRLADFGVALVRDDDGQVVGTPGYLDPVVATGSPPGPRSDVYGLGVVLYEALAGQPPFAGDTPAAVLRSADRGDHLPLASLAPDTPPGLAAVVEQAMDRDPARRPASARRLQVELEHLLQPSGGQERPTTGRQREHETATGPGGEAVVTGGAARGGAAEDVAEDVHEDGDDGPVSRTTVYGPRPPVRLSVPAQRPAWVVATVAVLVALPLAATAWLSWRAWSRGGPALGTIAAPVSPGPATPDEPHASAPRTTRTPGADAATPAAPTPAPLEPAPLEPAPTAAASTAATEQAPAASTAPTEPTPARRTPSPACGDLVGGHGDALVDVDGRGCSLPLGVAERDVDGEVVMVVSVPPAAGRLAGEYALPGPPRAVVFGDWDCDGAETPAVVVGGDGRVWGFDGFGALEARELDEPVGAASPVVVTDGAGCDHVVPSD